MPLFHLAPRTACVFRRMQAQRSSTRLARAASSSAPPSALGAARASALLTALKQIEHSFGKNSVMQLGQKSAPISSDAISSGSLSLDLALGIGGFPRGRVVEIYGPESSGKTTLALHVVAEAQKKGLSCVFIDAEHALDPKYAAGLGVDLDALYVSQPDTGEQALEIADTLVRSGGMDVVVVDSVAALVPKAELEGEMGDSHMALQARLMSQALRKLTSSLAKTKTLIIFINQIRSKVGVIFGSPDITSGGNALKFYASVRCEIRRTSIIKDKDDNSIGSMTRVKVAKNKLAPPFRTAEFEMSYGMGINRTAEAVDLGAQFGVLKKSGAFYSVASEELAAAMNAAEAAAAADESPRPALAASAAAPPVAVAPIAYKAARGKKKQAQAASVEVVIGGPSAGDAAAPAMAAAGTETAPAGASASASAPDLIVAGSPFAQGREKAKAFLEARPAALEALLAAVRKAMFTAGAVRALPPASAATVEDGGE